MAELLREGPRLILRRAAEEDMFSDIPLDTAPAGGDEAVEGPASTNLDEIQF